MSMRNGWFAAFAALTLGSIAASPAWAEGERAGDFDYWVLSLSWSPSWCATEGTADGAEQCDPRADFGWILHGLWPQYETGWPSYCVAAPPPPDRAQTAAMADIMGSAGLAWYQWRKHGGCAGLPAETYFALARAAFDRIARPAEFRALDRPARIPADTVAAAFLEANPGLTDDMLVVTCRAGRIAELRICLARDGLFPRPCGADLRGNCGSGDALMAPIP
jgi:ribonuclease T2